jgi:Protein of unknown function (DUF3761)
MKTVLLSALAAALTSTAALAMPPAGAPSGTMGMCNDGSYSSSAEKKGACRGHKGVKDWYGEEASMAPAPGGPRATASPAKPAMPDTPSVPAKTTPAMAGRTSQTPGTEPAPGGGPGKVWGNTSKKVYHCSGDKYYGTTKHGEYMSESDAKAKGYHADHGKACV